MVSINKLLIPAVVGASMLLAACGGSSHSSSAGAPASAPTASSSSSQPSGGSSVELATAKGPMGTYLVGASGRAVYMWVADTGDRSSCSGACAKAWPPVISSTMPKVSGGVSTADLSLITRSDGAKQVAYKGHPLYYFVADTGPGMVKGQGSDGFGAKWWLIAPSGKAISAHASSAGASTTASSNSSSGSSSGGSSGGGWG